MPVEIERKFLVLGKDWKDGAASRVYKQGYLSQDTARNVRVRLAGEQAFLTIKGIAQGISRQEFEYPIPPEDAKQLLTLCVPTIITKTRYFIDTRDRRWEVDEFHGDNEGLVIAETELQNENEAVALPPWVGREVSHDPRYFNAALAQTPFCQWPDRHSIMAADGA